MEAPRLVVGAALRAPPPPPQFRPYRLLPPRSASHFLPFARRTPLIRSSYSRKGKDNAGVIEWSVSAWWGFAGWTWNQITNRTIILLSMLFQRTNLADVQRKGDIADLFSEAQRNILQLNKQRLVAIEELKKLRDENKSLLQDIQVIETEAQGVLIEAAQSSSFCELLLRIDTMVISGLITTTEASDIRKKVVDNQLTIRRAFSDIHLKPDTELLSELRLFMRKLIDSVNGVGLILIEPVQLSYFNREMLCGYPDDFERFSYFSRASLDYIVKSGKQPDILHIHNWETAIVAPLFWDIFAHQGLENTRITLTCLDLDSQCLVEPAKLELCGLDPHKLHRADRLQDPNKTHLVNIMKGGIVYSNKVVLVSSTHSKDVLIQGLRHGLEATLTAHKDKILVASHGLDGELWDPSKDIYLPRRYSVNDIEGKSFCKEALKRRLGFRSGSSIIVGCICDGNSNIHNLKEAVQVALLKSAQVIFLENLGAVVNSTVRALKEELKGDNITFVEVYDEALVHLIFAGSDIILCSSFQDRSLQIAIKAIKYGSVPVQINFPSDKSRLSEGHNCHNKKMSQYIFSTYGDLSLSEALDDFKNDPYHWDGHTKDGMAKGLSWDAECYELHWEAYSSVKQL
ncbi:hypothetical protein EJB05_19292 [Eragrostis curvula]|uniref:starch synthase n=1 Tax=Eragrostis curvula TaxID=38414 RepID=A0A5J9UWZ9_9POAL|nr:hypothetical protein EJB05_19292 [Eragrostis curvula]